MAGDVHQDIIFVPTVKSIKDERREKALNEHTHMIILCVINAVNANTARNQANV